MFVPQFSPALWHKCHEILLTARAHSGGAGAAKARLGDDLGDRLFAAGRHQVRASDHLDAAQLLDQLDTDADALGLRILGAIEAGDDGVRDMDPEEVFVSSSAPSVPTLWARCRR